MGNAADDMKKILMEAEMNGGVKYENGEIINKNLESYIDELNLAIRSGAIVAGTDLNYGPNTLPYKVFRKA